MKKWNLDKLVSIEVIKSKESRWYTYRREPKKYFWQSKPGYYFKSLGVLEYQGTEPPRNHSMVDGKVFEDSCVIMRFVNRESSVIYFKDDSLIEDFITKVTQHGKFKDLENLKYY